MVSHIDIHVYFQMDECTICQKPIDGGTPTVRLGEKGCMGIHTTNINHTSPVEVKPGDTVHIQYRKDFTRPKLNNFKC